MKKITQSLLVLLSFAIILSLSSCRRSVSFQTLRPADITLPENFKKAALVNRAVPAKSNTNVLEGVITGELPGQDKQGRQQVLMGLQSKILNNPAFNTIIAQEELTSTNTGSEFAPAMQPYEVSNLCNKYGVDGLVVMEHYDSDCIPGAANIKKEKVTNKDGSTTEKTYFEVVQVGNVRSGFRIYEKNGKVLDEFEIKKNMTWTTRGSNALDAIGSTLARIEYMNKLSNQLGAQYSTHIAPFWITVSRRFYRKGKNPLLKVGGRYAATGNWLDAESTFNQVIQQENGIGKDAARAYYNLGLCYEMKGDFYKAKDCVSKAYALDGKNMALEYSNILSERINAEEKVHNQIHK